MKKYRNEIFIAAVIGCVLSLGGMLSRAQDVQPVPQAKTPVVDVPGSAPKAPPDVPSQPAVAVTEVKSPAAPAHYTDQALWALMMSFVIQWLKKSSWFGWITDASASKFKTQFGFLIAFLTAAGVHFAISGNVWEDGGASVTVSGLSFNLFKDVAWQWTSQQAWYRAIVKEPREVTLTTLDQTGKP